MLTVKARGNWIVGTMDRPMDKIGSIHTPVEAQKGKIRNLMRIDSVGQEVTQWPDDKLKPGSEIFVRGFTEIPNTQQCYIQEGDVLGQKVVTKNSKPKKKTA